MIRRTEGTVGFRTGYKIAGELHSVSGKLPLLVIHGGPGFPHDYLEELVQLAGRVRAVVVYDQLGCGKSDHPDDHAPWVMDTFHDEAYVEATMAYYSRWVCRRDPFPEHVISSFMNVREEVYGAMQGPE